MSCCHTYDVGDLVRISSEFTLQETDAATDPTSVFVQVLPPSGTIQTYQYGVDAAVIKSGTGEYYYDVDATEGGRWRYRWYSTGTGQAAAPGEFLVKPNPLAAAA